MKQREENGKEIIREIEKNPSLYDKMLSDDIKILQTIGEEEIQFFKAIKELKKENSEMIK